MTKRFYTILLLVTSCLGFSQNTALFEKANKLYNDGKYQEAIEVYNTIEKSNEHAAALYFNLGNCYYKLNQIAPSIYYYEKALLFNPRDEDVLINLQYAQNMVIDEVTELPKTNISRFLDGLLFGFHYRVWAILSIVFMMLFAVMFILYYYQQVSGKKRLFFVLGMVAFLFSAISVFSAFRQQNIINTQNPAIIFSKEVSVKAEPNLRSSEAFLLHEGTKVEVVDQLEEWRKIRLPDGKTGWLTNDTIKVIKEF